MSPDDLSPADRELAQLALVRVWLGRKARARYASTHGPTRRYQLNGQARGHLASPWTPRSSVRPMNGRTTGTRRKASEERIAT